MTKEIKSIQTELAQMYRRYIAKLTDEDMEHIAQIKRFHELYAGIPSFREELVKNLNCLTTINDKYKLSIDLELAMPWLCMRYKREQLPSEIYDKYNNATKSPMLNKWIEYNNFLLDLRTKYRSLNDASNDNPRFEAWRQRQIKRCDDTLKTSADQITHPSFAFELSNGCSVGCWFCGISAEKFAGYFPYNKQNKQLWRDMIYHLREIFGLASIQSAFCYWATDPTDNPDYLNFIKDFYQIAGIQPQTTLAKPTKDVEWTNELLNFSQDHCSIVNRFSIVSISELKAVHKAFTPRELFHVQLLMQHKQGGISAVKSNSGRARTNLQSLATRSKDSKKMESTTAKLGLSDDHTTIACVSGFLINLCQKKIQLISPRPVSKEFPLGYKVHATQFFENINSFNKKINLLVEAYMTPNLEKDKVIRFREDLEYCETAEGFTLRNMKTIYKVRLGKQAKILGRLIYQNQSLSYKEILKKAVAKQANIFVITNLVSDLFSQSLFSDNVKAVPAKVTSSHC